MRLSITLSIIILGFLSFVSSLPAANTIDTKALGLEPLSEVTVGDTFFTCLHNARTAAQKVIAIYVSTTQIVFIPIYTTKGYRKEIHFNDINLLPQGKNSLGKDYSWFSRDILNVVDPEHLVGKEHKQAQDITVVGTLANYLKKPGNKRRYTIYRLGGSKLERSEADEIWKHLGEHVKVLTPASEPPILPVSSLPAVNTIDTKAPGLEPLSGVNVGDTFFTCLHNARTAAQKVIAIYVSTTQIVFIPVYAIIGRKDEIRFDSINLLPQGKNPSGKDYSWFSGNILNVVDLQSLVGKDYEQAQDITMVGTLATYLKDEDNKRRYTIYRLGGGGGKLEGSEADQIWEHLGEHLVVFPPHIRRKQELLRKAQLRDEPPSLHQGAQA